jgi:nickel superoxide dismutase
MVRDELRPAHAESAGSLLVAAHIVATEFQARIDAESVQVIQEQYRGNDDPTFRERAIQMKGAALRPGEAPPVDAVDRLLQAPALREVPEANKIFWKTKHAA